LEDLLRYEINQIMSILAPYPNSRKQTNSAMLFAFLLYYVNIKTKAKILRWLIA